MATDESDLTDDDESDGQRPTGDTNYLTSSGYTQLQNELEHLVKKERPSLVEVVAWAAGNGDRSENGDYIYGKRRLREIDRRIRFLSKRLSRATVVDVTRPAVPDRVFFGATVTYWDEAAQQENTVTIVGQDETGLYPRGISLRSPLALALLRAEVGERLRFQTPLGWRQIEVVDIVYQAQELGAMPT